MTQSIFLLNLKNALEKNGAQNINDILGDYREHFTAALASGRSEEEICDKLGNPEVIAKAFEAEAIMQKVQHPFQVDMIFKVLGRMIIIAPFNFLMLLIPGFFIGLFLFVGWVVTGALLTAGFAMVAAALKIIFSLSLTLWLGIALLCLPLGLLGLPVLGGLVMYFLSKAIMTQVFAYFRWNLDFILTK